jgi:peroxiredoxin
MQMEHQPEKPDKETLINLVKQGIEMLAERNISNVVILSSYKINSVLKDNYGINIKVDRIGRILSTVAKNNQLKRLNTNIPKYKLQISKVSGLQYF